MLTPLPASQLVVHTEEEWKQLLTPNQYSILRRAGTELPTSRWVFVSVALLHSNRALGPGVVPCGVSGGYQDAARAASTADTLMQQCS